eukprot:GHVU01023558.1.p2 GENE.GHVU01023558.1~~GHVU01023558.1.p2  ORF type:complete len:161 (-),score=23.75 GHVU01023558.1:22-504(-)
METPEWQIRDRTGCAGMGGTRRPSADNHNEPRASAASERPGGARGSADEGKIGRTGTAPERRTHHAVPLTETECLEDDWKCGTSLSVGRGGDIPRRWNGTADWEEGDASRYEPEDGDGGNQASNGRQQQRAGTVKQFEQLHNDGGGDLAADPGSPTTGSH